MNPLEQSGSFFGTNQRKEKDTHTRYTKKFIHYLCTTRAVSALEYAILVGVIAIAISAALVAFSGNLTTALQTIGAAVAGITAKGGVQ